MGTSKPLTIWVHPTYLHQPWVRELQEQGHTIYCEVDFSRIDPNPWTADLILGPNCARFLPGMEKFLPSFLKGVRVLKYGKVKK